MSTVTALTRIERAAVVGAGNMGSGIAQKIATEGYPVIARRRRRGAGGARDGADPDDRSPKRWRAGSSRQERVDEILARITPATDARCRARTPTW